MQFSPTQKRAAAWALIAVPAPLACAPAHLRERIRHCGARVATAGPSKGS